MTETVAAIIVGNSSSKCGRCQRPTLVDDQAVHDRVVGYGWESTPGCGARFTAITTDSLSVTDARLAQMRPDLPVIPYEQRNSPPGTAGPAAPTGRPGPTGHPDCRDCRGQSRWWQPDGHAELCERCQSCCECTCGEPLTSDYIDYLGEGYEPPFPC